MEREVCLSASEALDLTVLRQYSALVLDFDLPGAATVARMARLAPSHRRPVIFGMIGAFTEIAETFQAGVNFIIYKPLVFDQIVRCLRAGRGFMRPDRRQTQRQPLESLVYLQFGIAALPAMVLDLNQNGMALQAPEPLPPVQQVPLRFVLPGTTNMVEGMGEVIWADDGGRAGMLFSRLTPASTKVFEAVVRKNEARRRKPPHVLFGARKLGALPQALTKLFVPFCRSLGRPFQSRARLKSLPVLQSVWLRSSD